MQKPASLNASRLGKATARAAVIMALLGLGACITVNVNFPESAVERAADDFVKDLYKSPSVAASAGTDPTEVRAVPRAGRRKSTGKSPAAAPQETEKKPLPSPQSTSLRSERSMLWAQFLEYVSIPQAHAQEINTHTPRADEIRARMRERVSDLTRFKAKGVLCEMQDGSVQLRDAAKAGADAGQVARIVKSENADRDALYEEIQTANKINDRKQTKIRRFFAAAFRQNSPAGTCFENEDGSFGVR